MGFVQQSPTEVLRPLTISFPQSRVAMPDFSIITVCYNSAATVADTLRSVLEQTGVCSTSSRRRD